MKMRMRRKQKGAGEGGAMSLIEAWLWGMFVEAQG